MFLIEPCCTQKHITAMRDKIADGGTTFFHGYGDLSLAELLPVVLTPYSETDMLIAAPTLPNSAAKVIKAAMEKQWPTRDGKGLLNTIKHLTLVTDLRKSKSPLASAWMEDNPFPDRLTLINKQQNDTALLLPDFAIYGPLNLTYSGHFTGIATRRTKTIEALREVYTSL